MPDTEGRYYLLPMLDMWTDVFSVVGSRTTGTKRQTVRYVRPGWSGTLPEGVSKIVASTWTISILGRTQTNGPADYANVHKVQDGYKLTPLSQWGKEYTPPKNMPTVPSVDNKTPPLVQVNKLDGVAMLTRLAELMAKYPPHANDYPILFRLRALGIEPGKPFDAAKLNPETVSIINKAAKDTLEYMPVAMTKSADKVNGWNIGRENMGTYGTSYQRRANGVLGGLGANLPEDAVYPVSFVDGEGKPLSGANKYVLHFEKGKTPPADAFWSITMYDKDGFQIPNPINRYAIGDRDKLTFNADGSLDIYVQANSPGKDKEANWLPAPKTRSSPPCASTRRGRRCWTAHGRHRPSRKSIEMDAVTFFAMFSELMKENPPHANDYPILDRIKRIGIVPGKSFSLASAPKEVQDALNAAPADALKQIKATWSKSGALANGWRTNLTAIGTYGADYSHRAGVAYAGLGANVTEAAVYPTALVDADGQPFSSDKRYVLQPLCDRRS